MGLLFTIGKWALTLVVIALFVALLTVTAMVGCVWILLYATFAFFMGLNYGPRWWRDSGWF